jgi:hypothetical protein
MSFDVQSLGQVGCSTTGFDRYPSRLPVARDSAFDLRQLVGDGPIGERAAFSIHYAYLHRILVVIQTDKNWYT